MQIHDSRHVGFHIKMQINHVISEETIDLKSGDFDRILTLLSILPYYISQLFYACSIIITEIVLVKKKFPAATDIE